MTTITYNAAGSASGSLVSAAARLRGSAPARVPAFARMKAALPQMKPAGTLRAAADFAVRAALTAVPFAALSWLFIAN